jgi:hypothetical protein
MNVKNLSEVNEGIILSCSLLPHLGTLDVTARISNRIDLIS